MLVYVLGQPAALGNDRGQTGAMLRGDSDGNGAARSDSRGSAAAWIVSLVQIASLANPNTTRETIRHSCGLEPIGCQQ